MSTVATRITELLSEHGLTRADLARLTNIPYHRINPWFVRENAKPNGADLEAVARVLEVSVSYLIHGGEREMLGPKAWIAATYDQLDPEQQQQLEGFVRFLLSQQNNPGKSRD
ncbi:helix-turn-helix domain-containing protein [Paracoccus sp. ME4]|uniref:helix-turn-helix domain-containing protein n=1 Tax=Paracoccus sp. ME4 TaxID=3138066 RepID=UPI00398AC87B